MGFAALSALQRVNQRITAGFGSDCSCPSTPRSRRYNRPGMRSKQRRFPFVQLDVFSSVALEGNPLAVFPHGRGVRGGEMQGGGRGMKLSETTFVLPNGSAGGVERRVAGRSLTVE